MALLPVIHSTVQSIYSYCCACHGGCLQKVFFIMVLGSPQDYNLSPRVLRLICSGPCLSQIRKMLDVSNNNFVGNVSPS